MRNISPLLNPLIVSTINKPIKPKLSIVNNITRINLGAFLLLIISPAMSVISSKANSIIVLMSPLMASIIVIKGNYAVISGVYVFCGFINYFT